MYASLLSHTNSLFGPFERLRRELDDVLGVSGLPSSIRSVTPGTLPAFNVGRTPTSIEVYAFAPGLDPSKIDVSLDRGVLRIAGERAASAPCCPQSMFSRAPAASRCWPTCLACRRSTWS